MSELLLRRRALMAAQPRLPWEFQEVAWIANLQNFPYIEAGFTPTGDSCIRALVQFPRKNGVLFFQREALYKRMFCIFAPGHIDGLVFDYGNVRTEFSSLIPSDNPVFVELAAGKIKVSRTNGEVVFSRDVGRQSFVGVEPLKIFSDNGNPIYLHAFERWSDANMTQKLRDYVPCYRRSDRKPGLYDLRKSICPLTNSPFYINSGTGDFTVGPDVK